MGNCQAAEAATVVIQHPDGKIQRLYWPTTAAEVMKSNPGLHVALLTLCIAQFDPQSGGRSVRVTHVRLLRPKDVLLTGQVYKLIDSQEVSRALKQRRQEKLVGESSAGTGEGAEADRAAKQERSRTKTAAAAARSWRPSLQSISEGIS